MHCEPSVRSPARALGGRCRAGPTAATRRAPILLLLTAALTAKLATACAPHDAATSGDLTTTFDTVGGVIHVTNTGTPSRLGKKVHPEGTQRLPAARQRLKILALNLPTGPPDSPLFGPKVR